MNSGQTLNSRFRNKTVIAKLVLLFITWVTVAYTLMNLKGEFENLSIKTMENKFRKYEWAMHSTAQVILNTTNYLGISSETVKTVGGMLYRKVRARNLTFRKRNAVELVARIGVGLGAAYAGNATGVNRIAQNALAPFEAYNTMKHHFINKPGYRNKGYMERQARTLNQVHTLLIYIMGLLAQFEYNVVMEVARTIIPQNSQTARTITNGLGAALRLTSGYAYSSNNGTRTRQVMGNWVNLTTAGGRLLLGNNKNGLNRRN